MKSSTAPVLLSIAALLLAGCATKMARPLPDATWRAFLGAGNKNNRLMMHDTAPLDTAARHQLNSIVVKPVNGDPALLVQQPLTGGAAAKRGAKLWLGWHTPDGAMRLSRGKPQHGGHCQHGRRSGDVGDLFAGSGEGAAVILLGYILYMPIGATAGAISGAVSAPNQAESHQALDVVSNSVARIDVHCLLVESVTNQLQRSDRGLLVQHEVSTTEGQATAIPAILEVSLYRISLEGGAKPNPGLWLSVDWSAHLRFADNPELNYSTGGVWQSDEERKLRDWAADDGARLDPLLHEAFAQIAAVISGQIVCN
jgi:hypothetical protein